MAVVIALPIVRVERGDLDLARQRVPPDADCRNIVELWRAKAERDIARHLREAEGGGHDAA